MSIFEAVKYSLLPSHRPGQRGGRGPHDAAQVAQEVAAGVVPAPAQRPVLAQDHGGAAPGPAAAPQVGVVRACGGVVVGYTLEDT